MKDLVPAAGNGLYDRRAFLRGGAALAAAMTAYSAKAETLTEAPWGKEPGELVPTYGTPSKHEKAARMDETGCERCGREARRHLGYLPRIRHRQGTIGDDRTRFGRRQVAGIDLIATADLVLGEEILLERIGIVMPLVLRGRDCGKRQRCRRGQKRRPPLHGRSDSLCD